MGATSKPPPLAFHGGASCSRGGHIRDTLDPVGPAALRPISLLGQARQCPISTHFR